MNINPEPLVIAPARQRLETVRSAFGFRHRGLMGLALFVPLGLAALFTAPVLAGHAVGDLLFNAGGWMAFFAYVALRLWATLYVGGNKDRELQTEGPYSLCRNPLYLGSFAFAVAIACFLKSLIFGAALLPATLLYLQYVVRAEEHFLELRFQDDYRNYCRRTPRFWPRWSAFCTPAFIRVDLKRLRMEAVRLVRAGLFIIVLQALVQFRGASWWPHWLTLL